jgi:hypothetical protein
MTLPTITVQGGISLGLRQDTAFTILLLTKYYQVDESKEVIWEGRLPCVGEIRNTHSILVGKPEGKRPLGRPRRR